MREHTQAEYEGIEALYALCDRLPSWYEKEHRALPWREQKDPYSIWLSEIMCQQTRISAVIGYYKRFKEALPDIDSLAAVDDDYLMKLWEGLGYYSRARNLKKAAQLVSECCDGKLPGTYQELLKLPGIGSYTAGAIASIAFGERVPAVDGNVLRICSRITGNSMDIGLPQTKKALERAIQTVMEQKKADPGILNQAMMELGALICVPNGEPLCPRCPMRECCRARKENRIGTLPVKQKKKKRSIRNYTVLVIRSGDCFYIRKRKENGLLAGLYELPMFEGELTEEEAVAKAEELGFEALHVKRLSDAKHIFTHVEWHMKGFRIRTSDLKVQSVRESADENETAAGYKVKEGIFAPVSALREIYSIPSAFSAYLQETHIRL